MTPWRFGSKKHFMRKLMVKEMRKTRQLSEQLPRCGEVAFVCLLFFPPYSGKGVTGVKGIQHVGEIK